MRPTLLGVSVAPITATTLGLTFAVASVYDRLELQEGKLLAVEALFCRRSHPSISNRHSVDQNQTARLQFS